MTDKEKLEKIKELAIKMHGEGIFDEDVFVYVIEDKIAHMLLEIIKGGYMEELLKEVETLKVEYEKFTQGNKSAGTKARKALQAIKKHAQNLRKEIQSKKNA
jgi:hypothetical protein